MREAGVDVPNEWELPGDFSEASGHRAVGALLALDPRPTAVFAANDSMAIGAISALREAGLRVPEDMAVTGFDDIPIARYVSPPLTSVHVSIAEMGARAVKTLLDAMVNKDAHTRRHQRLETTLVIRESCGSGLRGECRSSRLNFPSTVIAVDAPEDARARSMQRIASGAVGFRASTRPLDFAGPDDRPNE